MTGTKDMVGNSERTIKNGRIIESVVNNTT